MSTDVKSITVQLLNPEKIMFFPDGRKIQREQREDSTGRLASIEYQVLNEDCEVVAAFNAANVVGWWILKNEKTKGAAS